MTVTLPWPPNKLNPNARPHWATKAKEAKRYRATCAAIVRTMMPADDIRQIREAVASGERLHLWITFDPPDRRPRDDDNVLAAFKSGRDGIADALGIDDRALRVHPWLSDTPIKGGAVRVRLSFGPEGVVDG